MFSIKPYRRNIETHVGVTEDQKTELVSLFWFVLVGGSVAVAIWLNRLDEKMPETIR
jgi:hypothetical protein